MHMADALVSPAIGGGLWALSAAAIAYSSRQLTSSRRTDHVAMMGVMGAFVFAVQMINFTIPGTGSSGHLGGGLLLAVILGPHAALITMTSILSVQALLVQVGPIMVTGGWVSFASILMRFLLTAGSALTLVAITGFRSLCLALEKLLVPKPLVVGMSPGRRCGGV